MIFSWYDWLLLIITGLLQLPDVITTNMVLSQGGKEIIPTVRWAMKKFGRFWWFPKVFIALIMAILILIQPDSLTKYIFLTIWNLIFVTVAVYNYLIWKKLKLRNQG